jgi:hypothetical protein
LSSCVREDELEHEARADFDACIGGKLAHEDRGELAEGAVGPLVEFEAGLLDGGREDLEVFHAGVCVCGRGDGELVRV